MAAHPFLNRKAIQYKGITIFLLVFMLVISLSQFASFSLIQNHVVGYYGAQPEDVSMALLAMYAGIVTMLPLHFRLIRYVTLRKYLLTAFSIGIAVSCGSYFTHDIFILTVLRFFQGNVAAVCAGSMLIVIFSTQPEEKKSVIGSAVFFGAILSTAVIIGIFSSWITVNMNWNNIYFVLIGFQALAMLICYCIFQQKRVERAYPLYQVDWPGALFFGIFAVSLAFVLIYGSKRYWFADHSIRTGAIISFVMLLLYLYLQFTLKRPSIDLSVFKYGKFLFGLVLLLLFYGIKDTITLIYAYAGGILGWSATDIVKLGIINITGVIFSIWLAAKLILRNKQSLPKVLISGYVIMVLYNLWMYYFLTPSLSFSDLAVPVFLQGMAAAFIFLSIMLFTLSAVPPATGFTGIIVCACARFIASLNSVAGFYNLQLFFMQHYRESFLIHLTSGEENFIERSTDYQRLFLCKGYTAEQANMLSNTLMNKAMGIQGQLLTNRAIFFICASLILLSLVLFVLFAVLSKLIAFSRQRQLAV